MLEAEWKPIAFGVGANKENLKMALQKSREQLGDDATLLYDPLVPSSMIEICKSHGKEKGGPWECYHAFNFFGWEAERVVAVTNGYDMMEMITRARTHLAFLPCPPSSTS